MTTRIIDLGNGAALLCPARPLAKQVLPPRQARPMLSDSAATVGAVVALAFGLYLVGLAVFQ